MQHLAKQALLTFLSAILLPIILLACSAGTSGTPTPAPQVAIETRIVIATPQIIVITATPEPVETPASTAPPSKARTPASTPLPTSSPTVFQGLLTAQAYITQDHATYVAEETLMFTPTIAAECAPTDQDVYVYEPKRLKVLSPCVRVLGVVRGTGTANDGDGIIDLDIDPPFKHFLVPVNFAALNGALHLEVICYLKDSCPSDPDPLRQPLPKVGDRIWAEGRWVLDVQHGDWAELHPVYRWGVAQ